MELRVVSYAVAGDDSFPRGRVVDTPPHGARRKARLPTLAAALARCAIGDRQVSADTGVSFGTALGCLTETAAFVENMIRENEEMPKPRAFSSSVHNAIASRVALDVGAHGPCRTFVHGAVSFVQALFAARTPALVGGLDERTSYVEQICPDATEGGAVLYCADDGPGLAVIRRAVFARSERRIVEALREADPDITLRDVRDCATATAKAVAMLSGEIETDGEPNGDPRSIAVVVGSRLGDHGLVLIERCDPTS